ncbi:methyltransferase domain-containing protein [Kriegella sp. EG-1]|nr:methyltransferase domain-containing protein [Flavobacteriaceae bacterium EG-1]
MTDFWNERYKEEAYAYGVQPNVFVKSELGILSQGTVLFAAEGEGRNAVYALQKGWNVEAFDYSVAAKNKAVKLAKSFNLQLDYKVLDVLDFHSAKKFDVLVLCYAHFPISIREKAIQHLLTFLKPNGVVIFEAFSKNQLGKTSGGPKNMEMLFSIAEIYKEFNGLNFTELEETNIQLKEGNYHQGIASVIRFVGLKK